MGHRYIKANRDEWIHVHRPSTSLQAVASISDFGRSRLDLLEILESVMTGIQNRPDVRGRFLPTFFLSNPLF